MQHLSHQVFDRASQQDIISIEKIVTFRKEKKNKVKKNCGLVSFSALNEKL